MLEFFEARRRIVESVRRLGAERIPVGAGAGRVLFRDVIARGPFPAFDYSAMDGYAVQSSDLAAASEAAPVTLPLRGESRAGLPGTSLAPSSVARIFTGAALPPGADAVVMQEDVTREGDLIIFRTPPRPGDHVRLAGEDLQAGAVGLRAGTRLSPFHLGLLASLEQSEIEVARRPTVTILCTGDELRPPGTAGPPGSIADSNGVLLEALVKQVGGIPARAPMVSDDPDQLRQAFAAALEGCDLLLSVGGVSVGDRDLVRPTLEALGAEVDFWKVRMKPGKPLLFARHQSTLVLGLPGNPVSAGVTFALFGVPLLRTMQGDLAAIATPRTARLAAPLRQKTGRRGFYRGVLQGDRVEPLINQASGAITAMAWANALITVPEEVEVAETDTEVEVIAWADL